MSDLTREAFAFVRIPEFLEMALADGRAKKKEQADFLASETFRLICEAITTKPECAGFDSEEVSYFADEVKARLGLDFATKEDIRMFVKVVGDPQAPTVEPDSFKQDPDSSFGGCTFRHFGLEVFMMFGQGTFVSISNGRDGNAKGTEG
jgi:hypothetical protein